MKMRAISTEGNVTRLQPVPEAAEAPMVRSPRAEAARYISEMVHELERLANTSDLDVVGYFLAMARNEAELAAREKVVATVRTDPQAPYRAE